MLGLSPDHEVTGLTSVAPADRPPVQLTFQSYHLMIALGVLFILVFLLAIVLHMLGTPGAAALAAAGPHGLHPAVDPRHQHGLDGRRGRPAAVGRPGADAHHRRRVAAGRPPAQIWATLGLFGLIYLVLFVAWLRIFLGIIKKGPEDTAEMLEAETARSRRPRPARRAGAGR